MRIDRNVYGYINPNRGSEIYRMMDEVKKESKRMGVCLGIVGTVGYFLYRKVKNLTVQVEELKKKETGK